MSTNIRAGLKIALALSLSACAISAPNERGAYNRETGSYDDRSLRGYTDAEAWKDFQQTGEISYYANRFEGLKTASGERYSGSEMTAAHRELPFGTLVKVTNLKNGKSVVVRVNDRGPFTRGRVMDLSLSAAKELAMIGSGTAKARIEVVPTL